MSFKHGFTTFAVLTALAASSAQTATANTVTFEGLEELLIPAGTPWIEDGITAAGDPGRHLGSFANPGSAHLDDSGTVMTSFMDFTMPQRFRPIRLDILDPGVMAAGVPAPGGLSADELRALLAELAAAAELIGVELTAFEAPEDARERDRLAALIAGAVEPVLPA